jgi:hypothetical protein
VNTPTEDRDRVEYADRGSAAALAGLAQASGHSLEYVVRLAQKGELRTLFAGGRTYRWRMAPPPPRTPRHAQLAMWKRRAQWADAP